MDTAGMSKELVSLKVGRNDPCPCGSGKKFKKCHMGTVDALQRREARPAALHALDNDLLGQMAHFAANRFGVRWTKDHEQFDLMGDGVQLYAPWSVYVQEVGGRSVVDWFVAEHGRYLEREAIDWIGAQRKAWFSVWEAVEVLRGVRGRFVDRLTGEERTVEEKLGTREMTPRTNLLARVVDVDGISLFAGLHPNALSPHFAEHVVRKMKAHCRLRGLISREEMRSDEVFRKMARAWEDACDAQTEHGRKVPKMQNADREKLVLVEVFFDFDPKERGEIVERLAARKGAEHARRGDEDVVRISKRSTRQTSFGDRSIVGTVTIGAESLLAFANSRERADRLRRRVERACGGLVRFRERTEVDAREEMKRMRDAKERGEVDAGAEAEEEMAADELDMLRAFKERHYRAWPDVSLPALGGLTPREAMKTADGRRALDALIREMEWSERRGESTPEYDFAILRRALGLKG